MPRIVTALAVLVLAGFAGMFASSPAFASDPPGDCWQGALAHDPLHCRVLEAAQREGIVEVEGIYRTLTNETYVYLSKPDPVDGSEHIDRATADALKAKATEIVAQSPDSLRYDYWMLRWCVFAPNEPLSSDVEGPAYADASEEEKAKYRECVMMLLSWYAPVASIGNQLYGNVALFVGGAEARKQATGWAGWEQAWPAVPDATHGRPIPGRSTSQAWTSMFRHRARPSQPSGTVTSRNGILT